MEAQLTPLWRTESTDGRAGGRSKLPKAIVVPTVSSWAIDAKHAAAGSGVCPTGFCSVFG